MAGAPEAEMCGSSFSSVQGFVPGEGFPQPGASLPRKHYNRCSAVRGVLQVPGEAREGAARSPSLAQARY